MSVQRKRHPVSQAIRDLREDLNISQQELAFRTKMAIRTIARWEGEQPPHGKALLLLADLAQANDLNQIADVFRGALEDDLLIGGVGADPELKPWIEAVNVIFRFQEHEPLLWNRLTSAVIDGVRHIAAVTDRGKPDARLSALITTLMESAKLPAEREMDERFTEEQPTANRDDGEERERYEDWQLRQQEESQVGTPRKDPDER